MKKLILIRGPICAGKSTTTELLREALESASLIDQDFFKRSISRERSEWRSRIAFETSLHLAELLMEEERDIIADIHSSISDQYDRYAKLASKNGYAVFTFLLYPSLETCLQRNRARSIPDMRYQLTDTDIKKYWETVYPVSGEEMLDTSKLEPEEVVAKILLGLNQ